MINETLSALLSVAGRDVQLPANVEFSGGADPVLPTPFRITEAAAASLGAVGLAVADLWELRTGNRQDVGVNPRQATASLRSGQYMTIDGVSGWKGAELGGGSLPGQERPLELPALQFPQPPRRGIERARGRRGQRGSP